MSMIVSSFYYHVISRLEIPGLTLHISKLSARSQFIMETCIPIIFHSLNSAMNILKKDEFNNLDPVKKLVATYDNTFLKYGSLKYINGVKKYPLIVFEGLDATGKTTISRKIAAKHNASLLVTPPKCIADVRPFFEDHLLLRTPYYALGNYIGELEVLGALEKGPVILDRFWHSTTVYAIAQSIQNDQTDNLPSKGDKMYVWPSDLLKPDLVILLATSEEVRRKRLARRNTITNQEKLLKASVEFRKNIIRAYENMCDPNIEFVDGNGTIEEVIDVVDKKIAHLF